MGVRDVSVPIERGVREMPRDAVLVIDLQEEYIGDAALFRVPGGEALVESANRFVAAAREAGAAVIMTRYRIPDSTPVGLTTERLCSPTLHRDPVAGFVPGVVVAPTDIVIDKPRQSAFLGTDLELTLRRLGVTRVIIIGVAAHACCLATAIDAASRDFEVEFVRDLALSPPIREDGEVVMDPDEVLAATLRFVRYGLGGTPSSDEVLERLRAAARDVPAAAVGA